MMEDVKALIYHRSKSVVARTIPGERVFMNHSVFLIIFKLVGRAEAQIAFNTLQLPALEVFDGTLDLSQALT